MRRATPTLPAICALSLAVMLVGTALGASDRNTLLPLPHWLVAAELGALARVFGGATPIHTYYISYPKKIAVIFEFKGVVICRTCSGPSRTTQPRGRIIRVSFDRQTLWGA